MQNFRVGDVMSKHTESFQQLESVGEVLRTLRRSTHNAFPVVSHDFEGCVIACERGQGKEGGPMLGSHFVCFLAFLWSEII